MNLQSDIREAVRDVIARHVHDGFQEVYADIQRQLGIGGDIDPMAAIHFEAAEAVFVRVVANWLVGGLSFDQAEAIGMDGTLRS